MPVNRSLLWSPKDHGFRVYGCPEDMSINRCLLWSPKITGSEVYGCPEDMPVNRGLLMEPKRSRVQGLWMSRGHAC